MYLRNINRRVELVFMFLAWLFTEFMCALMLLLDPLLAACARFRHYADYIDYLKRYLTWHFHISSELFVHGFHFFEPLHFLIQRMYFLHQDSLILLREYADPFEMCGKLYPLVEG